MPSVLNVKPPSPSLSYYETIDKCQNYTEIEIIIIFEKPIDIG